MISDNRRIETFGRGKYDSSSWYLEYKRIEPKKPQVLHICWFSYHSPMLRECHMDHSRQGISFFAMLEKEKSIVIIYYTKRLKLQNFAGDVDFERADNRSGHSIELRLQEKRKALSAIEWSRG